MAHSKKISCNFRGQIRIKETNNENLTATTPVRAAETFLGTPTMK